MVGDEHEHEHEHEHDDGADSDAHEHPHHDDPAHESALEAAKQPLGDLDDHTMDVSPEVGIAESLRNALGTMREEADRIAALGTGEEQVEAAEQFAEDAGALDEQIGASARSVDDDERG